MFQYFIILLPFSFCILFLLNYLFKKDKTETQTMVLWSLAVASVYLYADALYVLEDVNNYRSFLIADIVNHYITPLLPLVSWLVLYSFRHPRSEYKKYYWLSAIAVAIGTICLTLAFLPGFSQTVAFFASYDANHTYQPAFDLPIFHAIRFAYVDFYFAFVTLEMALLLSYVIYYLHRKRFGLRSLYRFMFEGGEATPLILMCFCTLSFIFCCALRVGFGRIFWMDHQTLTAILSALMAFWLFFYSYLGLASNVYETTFSELVHPLLMAPVHSEDELPKEAAGVDSLTPGEQLMADALIELMENKMLFRNPNLTIEDVALQLETNRVIVSQIVERHLGMSFRDYLQKLRVFYAKRYMTLHPFETQEKVAHESGFADASSFNRKFRQMEGVTPKEWRLKQKK